MKLVSAYISDIGRNPKRNNEDYVWVDEKAGVYIVADGMGGQEAGEIASELAANTIGELVSSQITAAGQPLTKNEIQDLLGRAIETANETVLKTAKAAGQRRKMGATIVVALLQLPNVYISHAGDTRAYLARSATIMQLTRDDSWSAEMAAEGIITKEQARGHIYEHWVTKAIGQNGPVSPSFMEVKLTPGDWLLLCSDGLWNMVEDEDILAELQKAGDDPGQAVEALVNAANEAGGKDNISIAVIKLLG